ncbi:hypothetical protein [Pseudonocardia hierapolitana]|uniref:hypothetical protein n=1 Tax=Pseudonocardia hierapolitana TaxID=1128676 RepID=UPI0011BEAFBE|nr:hypothetical protein [Pseudonocardia hierapolitana]
MAEALSAPTTTDIKAATKATAMAASTASIGPLPLLLPLGGRSVEQLDDEHERRGVPVRGGDDRHDALDVRVVVIGHDPRVDEPVDDERTSLPSERYDTRPFLKQRPVYRGRPGPPGCEWVGLAQRS